MKWIVGNLVLPDAVPNLWFRPVPERIDLNDSKLFVPLHNMHLLTCQRLIPPKTANPSVDSTQCPHQRVDLADRATELAILHALVEQVNTVLTYHCFHFFGLRRKHLNSARVSGFCFLNQFVRLRKQPSCVQSEHSDVGCCFGYEMRDHLVFSPKRCRKTEPGSERLLKPSGSLPARPFLQQALARPVRTVCCRRGLFLRASDVLIAKVIPLNLNLTKQIGLINILTSGLRVKAEVDLSAF